jgi:hypothetical protein
VRRGVFHLDQPGDTVHQHTGFAGTSAGQDQLTPQRGRYGLALSIVEGIQQKGEIVAHRGILGGRGGQGKRGKTNARTDDRPVSPRRIGGLSKVRGIHGENADIEPWETGAACVCSGHD